MPPTTSLSRQIGSTPVMHLLTSTSWPPGAKEDERVEVSGVDRHHIGGGAIVSDLELVVTAATGRGPGGEVVQPARGRG